MKATVHKDTDSHGFLLWDIFGPFKEGKYLSLERAILMYDPFQQATS